MYKIERYDPSHLATHCQHWARHLLPIIDEYLNHGRYVDVDVKDYGTIHVGASARTLIWRFLTILSQPGKLEEYLAYNPLQQITFIRMLSKQKYPDSMIFNRLGKGTYKKFYKTHPSHIDHFNEVCHDIFITNGYDRLDSGQFIANTGLRICPYCGIETVRVTGRSKRQIDHFLPKGKYPFFAISYFNLIPSCDYCNESPNKGQKSPLTKSGDLVIMNPYVFKGERVRFHTEIAKENIFEPNNFKVILGFTEKKYLDGYNEMFDLSERYLDCNQEVSEDYRGMMEFKALHYYDEMHIDQAWLNAAYRSVLRYTDSATPDKKRLYRMRIDLFQQMLRLRKPGHFYTKRSGTTPEILE